MRQDTAKISPTSQVSLYATLFMVGVVVSAVVLAGAVGRIVFPYLIGPLAHSAGFRWAMGLAFVLAAAGALLAFFIEHAAALSAASEEG